MSAERSLDDRRPEIPATWAQRLAEGRITPRQMFEWANRNYTPAVAQFVLLAVNHPTGRQS